MNKEKEVITMARMYRMGTALFWSKLDGVGVAVLELNERRTKGFAAKVRYWPSPKQASLIPFPQHMHEFKQQLF
jgi:hypothetical protein